jgi:hypothetical protein
MRVIVRKERPHPGAQLRITDIDGHRITAFATNTPAGGPAPSYPSWSYATAAEPAPRTASAAAKDSGLRNLPLHEFTQNQIYCAIVALAREITTWMQLLALTAHQARCWEPKRLRLRLFSIAGQLATTARRRTPHLSTHAPWTQLTLHALTTLRALTSRPAPSG